MPKKMFAPLMAIAAFLVCFFAHAQAAPAPAPLDPGDFLKQVIAAVEAMGGLNPVLKLSSIIMLLIASMKVTYLNTVIWSKLGAFQIWVAPFFGLLAGVLSLGSALTPAAAIAYITVGAGAVFLHEILDLLKLVPGLGSLYVFIINMIESALGGGAPVPPTVATKK